VIQKAVSHYYDETNKIQCEEAVGSTSGVDVYHSQLMSCEQIIHT